MWISEVLFFWISSDWTEEMEFFNFVEHIHMVYSEDIFSVVCMKSTFKYTEHDSPVVGRDCEMQHCLSFADHAIINALFCNLELFKVHSQEL